MPFSVEVDLGANNKFLSIMKYFLHTQL